MLARRIKRYTKKMLVDFPAVRPDAVVEFVHKKRTLATIASHLRKLNLSWDSDVRGVSRAEFAK